jgi:hypothetical protein
MDDAGTHNEFLLAPDHKSRAAKMFGTRNVGVEIMNTIKMLGLAAVTALSLGAGAAMAQEGPNATVSGSAYFGNQAPLTQGQAARSNVVPSGSSDVETRPGNNSHYFWAPGNDSHNAGSQG